MAYGNGTPSIFVVSNRLPVTVSRAEDGRYRTSPSSGGLVSALQGLSGTSEFSKFRWFGWPGLELSAQDQHLLRDELAKQNATPVFLGKELADKHYNGFSNKILWPLLHYQLQEIHISQPDWEAYMEVNNAFAESLLLELQDGDIVWIQDYHLMLLASYLRQKLALTNKNVKLGFFLHTVFPSGDFFRILPVSRDILSGLLHCDLIGFHIQDYANHFIQACRKTLKLETTDSQVIFRGRAVDILVNPLGIDSDEFQDILNQPDVKARIQTLDEKYKGIQLMIAVDRLDYIKGIPLRIAAIDIFFTKHPEFLGKAALLQIVIPSREDVEGYRTLHNTINEACLFGTVAKPELAALYAASGVCIISSTRDGQNLVSFEYVTCQVERNGVLLLSEFAGASELLKDGLEFNPWDTNQCAECIYQALTMGAEERNRRWKGLNEAVRRNDSKRWGKAFLKALTKAGQGPATITSGPKRAQK